MVSSNFEMRIMGRMIDRNLVLLLSVVALIVFAWVRIEKRHTATSRGLTSMVLGCFLFSVGIVNLSLNDRIFIGSLVATGLFIALCGMARFVAWQVKNSS